MRSIIVFLTFLLFFSGCSSPQKVNSKKGKPVFYARSLIKGVTSVSGEAHFTERFGKVVVKVQLMGLKPNHRYGLYIHEYGDCKPASGSRAGGIYEKRKRGDKLKDPNKVLGFVSPKNGEYRGETEISGFSLAGTNSPLIGRSIVVHSNPSDLTGEHSGRFEQRIGCGIIGASNK